MYQKQIHEYVQSHREEFLQDIMTLVRINSERMEEEPDMPYGSGPAKALKTAKEMIEKYGFSCRNYGNRVVTADFSDAPKQLDVLAHLDVVPAGDGWSVTEPFTPVIVGGRLYGRGSVDDKGPAMCALYAMRAIKELKLPMSKSVRLVLGSDEECGSSDLKYYYSQESEAPMSFSPDAEFPLINIEKGPFHPVFEAHWEVSDALPRVTSLQAGIKLNVVPAKAKAVVKGLSLETAKKVAAKVSEQTRAKYQLTQQGDEILVLAVGEGAHASTPDMGNNAITALLTYLDELPLADCGSTKCIEGLVNSFPHGDNHGAALGINYVDEESGDLTLAFTMLTMDENSMKGQFDSRIPLVCTKENTGVAVKEALEKNGIIALTTEIGEVHYVPSDSELVVKLLQSYEKITGKKGYTMAIGGGTYVHHLKNGVAFGCMQMDTDYHMHGPDEFAVIDELLDSIEIFADAILSICG
ncbi:MAG: Sapep family Mn(2+)-dependent dipeptidase [Lachnospiraceae bacterium]